MQSSATCQASPFGDWPDIRLPSACAKHFEPITCDVPEQLFGHLAPRGIACANEQQFFPI